MRNALLVLFGMALLTVLAAGLYLGRWSEQPLEHAEDFTVVFEPGSGLASLSQSLENAGSLRCGPCFRILAEWRGDAPRLKAGEYRVPANASPEDVLNLFVSGQVIAHDVRIVEGITTGMLLSQLAANDVLTQPEVPLTLDNVLVRLDLDAPYAEGIFLPDTYQVRRGDRVEDVLLRAHTAMLGALESAWSSRLDTVALADSWALLVLASIIEKETGDPADRGKISQVFHRRLDLNMRLQTDPTVIYALGAAFDGNLRKADLRVDSPFNTYAVRGLPPTPIALPGRAAIEAAAQPADGDYLYFVARGDGTSQFSRTLDEHNRAVRKYQLGQRG